MTERYDVIVVGAGLAGALAAATAAERGARVLMVERGARPGATGPSAGVVRAGGASTAPPPGLDPSVAERSLVEHRMMVLDEAAAVSFDFRDVPKSGDTPTATTIRSPIAAERWAEAASARGARVLTGANQVHLNSDGRGAISGAAVGGESFEAPTTILTEAIGAKGAGSMRLEETFAISPKALENRFQVRDGQGSSIECLLGFLPAPWTGMGWVIPHRAHLTLGVTLHRPPGSEEGTGLESAYERFRGHPGIAGYTSGCERIDRRSYLAPIAPTRRRLAVPGLLLAGPAAGLGDPIGIVAPGLAPSLASARAAGEAVGPGAASSSKTSTAGSVYLARLRAWGILEQIDHARAHPIPLGWDGNARRRNSQILVRTFHELLTETGAPKEPITRTLRRVRRASGASYTSLAWDALTLGRNL